MSTPKLKPFPELKTDQEAEDFVLDADLSEYDFSGFKPMKFEFIKKTKSVLSLPKDDLPAD